MLDDPRVLPFEPKEKSERAVGFICLICGMTAFESSWELVEHLEAHERENS